MRAKAMEIWKQLSRYTQGLILIMVSILFFAWGVFGSATVDRQNTTIIQGIQAQHAAIFAQSQENESAILKNQRILLKEGKYITCILLTLPERRTPKQVHRCRREAGI